MNAALPALLARYDGNLPRYTSYPTAVRFSDSVGPKQASDWLEAIPPGEALSLYLHVPFCDELCSFCGCNTTVVRQENARAAYADLLCENLRRAGRLIPRIAASRPPLTHIQFGGGTPTTLPESGFHAVLDLIRDLFDIRPDAELSIELDPRHFSPSMATMLAGLGFTRGSLGVQDLDPAVQQACGRIQSLAQTRDCVEALRAAGIGSVNIDLIYGLPLQTTESIRETALQTATLRPDRLAVFGYAHVPWKAKRQQLMPEADLPGAPERIAQRQMIDQVLRDEGYTAIGLDHYALPEDSMARATRDGTLHRNFQGYTTDTAKWLVGIGASAVSSLPGGFTQNIVSPAAFARALSDSPDLPIARGVACTEDDRKRAALIEQIMCGCPVDLTPTGPDDFTAERERLKQFAADGLVELTETTLSVTETGRPFLRNIAAVFDRYLPITGAGPGQHSRAI
ncbi:oxygen-independent coproporphyrinogen III oxidase [Acetobacter fallax]|uniref:Coproporphyrinogen-III oxidase n=1 Tax=Acetobacter fallax TaxID=1737473 RepID=A0ABX0KD17_9PROT|nr:oxygen-independent coproporphyrinogen III oxidase [Acetobacter fallax]NHO32385.1 oxygen-independent coproporphyrinogen III oxidase [Acetobacter fallax]NHO35947.1 oxygen-independent coproporphyrinogen III oxidase [Acetobacter fallax]